MKRVITILLLTLLLCSTSFPVFALPENEVTVEIPVRMKATFSNSGSAPSSIDEQLLYYSVNNDLIRPLETGKIYYHAYNLILWYENAMSPTSGNLQELIYTVSLPGSGDVVIALPSTNTVYSKPEQNMSVTMGINILVNSDKVTFTKLHSEYVSATVYSLDCYFGPGFAGGLNNDIRAVAYDADSIQLTYYRVSGLQYGDELSVKVGRYGMHEFSYVSDTGLIGLGLPFGFFVSDYEPIDIFGSWIDPDASFSNNINSINNTLDYALNNTTSTYEKIFFSSYANYQLSSLSASSDANYVQQGAILNSKLDNIITSMNNSAANVNGYRTALDQFSTAYVEALKTAETPEQGDYITTIYQIKQQQLTNQAVINSTHAVQRVIKQEDLDAVTELDQLEESMFSELTLQKLEDTIYYNQWFTLLNSAEAMTYRTIFDFFINGSAWAYWIVVPMTFLIVSALLGTVIRMAGRPRRSSRGE